MAIVDKKATDYTQWLLDRYPRDDEFTVLALSANYDKISDAAQRVVHTYITASLDQNLAETLYSLRIVTWRDAHANRFSDMPTDPEDE